MNSLGLYFKGNPATIDKLLNMQASTVVAELQDHFKCSREELPIRLSLGQ